MRRLSQRDPDAAMRHTLDIEEIGRQALVEVREAVDYLSDAIGKIATRNRMEAVRVARDNGWLSVSRARWP